MTIAMTRVVRAGLLLGVLGLAVAGARPYAGGWNDGSRLAAVESLAERGTLAIDDSVFVRVPPGLAPYTPDQPSLNVTGTLDKLRVGGRYYSDKPPVATVLLAGLHRAALALGAPAAAESPAWFSWWLTVATAGGALLLAAWWLDELLGLAGLAGWRRVGAAASFALATMATAYTRHVNNHVLFLAAAAGVFVQVLHLARLPAGTPTPWGRLALLGTLAGLGYTLDLGCGPVLLACGLPWLAYRLRRPLPVAVVLLAALPWGLLHHGLNYAVGGTFKPINTTPEYFQWPGSPFDASNLTGVRGHTPWSWLKYSAAMLFGKRGFLVHNLPLLLLVPGTAWLWRRCRAERPEIALAVGWAVGTWLLYATFSHNQAGGCCSIRWFLPLLAPAYYLLALLLREGPAWRGPFVVLSLAGAALAASMWRVGPWHLRMVPLLWPINGLALAGLLALAWASRVQVEDDDGPPVPADGGGHAVRGDRQRQQPADLPA